MTFKDQCSVISIYVRSTKIYNLTEVVVFTGVLHSVIKGDKSSYLNSDPRQNTEWVQFYSTF